jgi:putative membrane protein
MNHALQLLLRFVLSAVSVLVVAAVLPGFKVKKFGDAFIFAILVAVFNVVAWQVLAILSIPFAVLTAGIGYFIVNGLVFLAAQKFVKGVEVSGCLVAAIAAILVGFVNTAINGLLQ